MFWPMSDRYADTMERYIKTTNKWFDTLMASDPPIGQTPKEVVWTKNKSSLFHYLPQGEVKHRTPVLLVYALINKGFILDLFPGMSLVEHLVQDGFDVFMLDWGEFQWEDRNLTLADLVHDYIAAVARKTAEIAGVDEISMLGYCWGGSMTAMYASLYDEPAIRNLVFLASPFDYTKAGVSSTWLKSPNFGIDNIVNTYELIPKEYIDFNVKYLNPVNNFISTYTRLWRMIDEGNEVTNWRMLNRWVNENTNFPGEIYRQLVKDFYVGNKLMKGEIELRGQKVDLSRIKSPVLALAGESDHIVLPGQTGALMDKLPNPDKQFELYPVGHGGLVFGSTAKQKVFPAISAWLAKRSGEQVKPLTKAAKNNAVKPAAKPAAKAAKPKTETVKNQAKKVPEQPVSPTVSENAMETLVRKLGKPAPKPRGKTGAAAAPGKSSKP
ncbi:MAG: PHA/PHB synthase family protein [Solirubrobacterales bacterium]